MWDNQEEEEDGASNEAIPVSDGGCNDGGDGRDDIEQAEDDQGHWEDVEPAGEKMQSGHLVLINQVEGKGNHQDLKEDE